MLQLHASCGWNIDDLARKKHETTPLKKKPLTTDMKKCKNSHEQNFNKAFSRKQSYPVREKIYRKTMVHACKVKNAIC